MLQRSPSQSEEERNKVIEGFNVIKPYFNRAIHLPHVGRMDEASPLAASETDFDRLRRNFWKKYNDAVRSQAGS